MANANRIKGLSPVRTGDGSPWNSQATLYAIATDAVNSYAIGDVVVSAIGTDANGVPTVTKYTAGTQTPLGIIVGISPTNLFPTSLVGNSLTLELAYLAAGNAGPAGYNYVYVVDDPGTVFEFSLGADAGSTGNITNFHKNIGLTVVANQTTLSQAAPFSSVKANDTFTTVAALASPIRIIGAVTDPSNVLSVTGNGQYTRLLGRWNYHEYFGQAAGV